MPRKLRKQQSRIPEPEEHLYEIQWKDSFTVRSHLGLSHPRKRSGHLHTISIRPNFGPGGTSTYDQKISLFELIILVLTIYWLLSFFGQSIVPGIRHTYRGVHRLAIRRDCCALS